MLAGMSDEASTILTDDTETTSEAAPPEQTAVTDESVDNGDQAGSSEQVTPDVPDSYALTVAEGVELPDNVVPDIEAFAKEHGLSQEAAQALLDRTAESGAAQAEAEAKAQADQTTAWLEESKQAFGAEFDQKVTHAKAVIDRFGSDALKDILNESGLGNQREIVGLLASIGAAMAEDSFVTGGAQGSTERSPAQKMYPDQGK